MYSLYIPKYKGRKASGLLLPEELGLFMKITNYSYDLLVSPGYLSDKNKTIPTFVSALEKEITAVGERNVGLGLFHGMNGYNRIAGATTLILDEHNAMLKPPTRLEKIAIDPRKQKDHRKMIFFIERNAWDITITLNSKNKDIFLNTITVKAVLIGSSNFSWSTYWNAGSPTPKKGEADLLMFVDKGYMKNVQNRINREFPVPLDVQKKGGLSEDAQMVLFERLAGGNHPQMFFKEILKNFLTYSLN